MNRREIVLGAAALAACAPAASQTPAPFPMRRGVNLGNALEAPNEGDWGYRIEDDHIAAIADAGFDGIRVPVQWGPHAAWSTLHIIAPEFLARVDHVVTTALARGLYVQLDAHHDDVQLRERFSQIWLQIANHFRDASDKLILEPFNEPNGVQNTGAYLSALQGDLTAIIRSARADRPLVLGPGNWQNIDALRDWWPPIPNVAVSVHYYEPHAFTHEGAEWLGAEAPRFGRVWGTRADHAQMREHIGIAARWGRQNGYAMQLGEFGANRAVPLDQRAAWTRAVRETAEAEGMGWCVWDFAGAFPIWDRETGRFIPELRAALLDQ